MKFTILLSILTFLVRCGTDTFVKPRTYDYTIENKSGTIITFIPYINENISLNHKVILNNNQTLNKKETFYDFNGGLGMTDVLFDRNSNPYTGGITHVLIVFDNNKKVLYKSCYDNYNCNSNSRSIFHSDFNIDLVETYTITADDYANATDCNGNCY